MISRWREPERRPLSRPAQVTSKERRRHVVTTAADKHGQSVVYSFRNWQPVQVTEQISDVLVRPHVTGKACSCTENRLELVQQVARNTRQGCAAVVESRQYYSDIKFCALRLLAHIDISSIFCATAVQRSFAAYFCLCGGSGWPSG